MLALFAALAVAMPPVAGPVTPVTVVPAGATVRITLNGGDYSPGDQVRVQVEPGDDGYLVVFRVDGDGRVRVLFPLDPDLDAYVRGGRRYEIRGRGERSTFLADDRGGTGIIYAALARDPMSFADYAVDDHWDYEMLRFRDADADADPEAELGAIVRRMTGNGRFDYDVVGYRIYDGVYAASGGGYDPYQDCLACGYPLGGRVSINIGRRYGYGWYDPYDPWLYGDAGYNAYRYGYGSPYGYGYGYNGWNNWGGWYTPYRPIVVYPTRPRPVTPVSPYGYRARSPQALAGVPTSFTPDLGRNVRPAPRSTAGGATYDGRSRVRNTTPQSARPTTTRRDAGEMRRDPPQERQPQPQAQPQREPQRETRPAAPAQEGNSGRSRRPNGNDDRIASIPAVDRQEATRRMIAPEESRPVFREPQVERRGEAEPTRRRSEPQREQPVYREPPRVERPVQREATPQRVERPVQREAPPQRVERPVQREAPPPRVERPAQREAPPQRVEPPAQREAPSPSSNRSRRGN